MPGRFDRKTWIKVGSWILILLVAPFSFEILILADVVGVDVALAVLVLYLKVISDACYETLDVVKLLLVNGLKRPLDRLRFLQRTYVVNVAGSCIVLWITGSILLSLLLWLPSFVILSQFA